MRQSFFRDIRLPTSLRSTAITPLHRYYGRSDFRAAGPPGLQKAIAVKQPRIDDSGVRFRFDGSGLSATSVTRMTEAWQGENDDWSQRSLAGKHYVYVWADGIYFGCRLSDDRPCVLVLMGATADGTKEFIAIHHGQRESQASWLEVLTGSKDRGLSEPPKLAAGAGQGLPVHQAAALLGTQDRQRAGQTARQTAVGGQGDAAPDLDGRHAGGGDPGLRPVHRSPPSSTRAGAIAAERPSAPSPLGDYRGSF